MKETSKRTFAFRTTIMSQCNTLATEPKQYCNEPATELFRKKKNVPHSEETELIQIVCNDLSKYHKRRRLARFRIRRSMRVHVGNLKIAPTCLERQKTCKETKHNSDETPNHISVTRCAASNVGKDFEEVH